MLFINITIVYSGLVALNIHLFDFGYTYMCPQFMKILTILKDLLSFVFKLLFLFYNAKIIEH